MLLPRRCAVAFACSVACVSPIEAWRTPFGGVQFGCVGSTGRILLPCGQCVECRLARSSEWALRCVHEAKLYRRNAFVTLTYGEGCALSLYYDDFRLFVRRARRELGPLRYFMGGEYGELNRRPHFHALLFGVDFPDRYFHGRSPSGEVIYRSPVLESLWKHGFSSCGEVTYESAGYVARYVVKKLTGQDALDGYKFLQEETGELVDVEPEFGRMSLNPGIGARFFERYHSEMTVRDAVVWNGVEHALPRYYDKLWERMDPEGFEEAKLKRQALRERGENAPARLVARRQVAEARLAFKRRGKV